MSYHSSARRRSLGSLLDVFGSTGAAAPTSPPTPLSEVYFEPGFEYLYVDRNRKVRPEFAAIIASGSVPGWGWTEAQVKSGILNLKAQVPLGPYNLSPQSPPWPGTGVTVYSAPFLGSPDGFFSRVPPDALLPWANQPGMWIVKFPGNAPFTKATWDSFRGGSSVQPPVPIPPQPIPPQPTPPQPTPPQPIPPFVNPPHVPPEPPPRQPGVRGWIASLSRDERDFLLGSLIGVALVSGGAVAWYYATGRHRGAAPKPKSKWVDYDVLPFDEPPRDAPLAFTANPEARFEMPMMWVRTGPRGARSWKAA